jgi:virginiamycin B lyase
MAKKKALIAIISALFVIIIIGAGVFLLTSSISPFKRPAQTKVVRQPPYTVHRSEEVPFSSHRVLSDVESQETTALLPWGIALDNARGFMWVAEPGCEPKPKCPATTQGILGQYAYSDSNFIQNFIEPIGYSSPLFVAVDKNGNVWFTQPETDAIGEFDIQSQNWNQWPLKKGSAPYDLVFDTSGNLWFTEWGTNKIGFFNLNTGQVVENPIPTPNSNPYGITVDPRGTMWFSENAPGVDQIGSFTTTPSGIIKITEHAVGAVRPHLITSDQAGNIWFTGGFNGDIGEFNPRTARDTLFVVYQGVCIFPANCTGTHISGIDVDNKGNVWFTDSLSQRVGYLVPATGRVVARTIQASNSHPYDGLLVDSSDRVWFTEEFGLRLTMWPASAVK